MRSFALLPLLAALLLTPATRSGAQPPSRWLRSHYRAADGTWVKRPRVYKRAPNRDGPQPTGTCRDGSVTFTHDHRGACSHHGGVQAWR